MVTTGKKVFPSLLSNLLKKDPQYFSEEFHSKNLILAKEKEVCAVKEPRLTPFSATVDQVINFLKILEKVQYFYNQKKNFDVYELNFDH